VVLGAIIIVGAESKAHAAGASSPAFERSRTEPLFPAPIACAEVLGRSLVERVVERFSDDVETISVLVDAKISHLLDPFRRSFDRLEVQVADDLELAVAATLEQYAENGVDYAFVTDANTYAECDLVDLLWFHRGTRQPVTQTLDRGGNLNLWVASCAKAREIGPSFRVPQGEGARSSSYFISGYVNRIAHPRDIRGLVEDVLRGRCEMRPAGSQVRPGVWVDDGAHLHKRARIVAPVYVGREAVIREDTVITRCSNVESYCYIDYGTVIEDSSILANSYVGIWLDMSHSVVHGNRLWNLTRNVALEISDGSMIRQNIPALKEVGGGLNLAPVPGFLQFAAFQ
jgi:NDP-sugar pyrophosphorylase family protein